MSQYSPYIYEYRNDSNSFYIMREDLLPFSFGGNKFRKNLNYFEEIIDGNYNHVVSYGSESSNHARSVANFCAKFGIKCTIIIPQNNNKKSTYNTKMNNVLKTRVINTPVTRVSETIKETIDKLKKSGETPYFIQGGGHGLLGTKAYVEAFNYIDTYSFNNNVKFDYIFLASGTGATQAGLIIGNCKSEYLSTIIGISVARKSKNGETVIKKSIEEYFQAENNQRNQRYEIIFKDDYLFGGYGEYNTEISRCIDEYMFLYGIPLDPTYTGKAVYGMHDYIKQKGITNKNILFIHTGGTPLYFDYLKEKSNA